MWWLGLSLINSLFAHKSGLGVSIITFFIGKWRTHAYGFYRILGFTKCDNQKNEIAICLEHFLQLVTTSHTFSYKLSSSSFVVLDF
jgi:hypothetical protein